MYVNIGSKFSGFSSIYVIVNWKQRLVGRHADTVMHVRFSPNAELLASCSRDGTVKLWDISTNTLLKEFFVGGTAGVLALTFSPDGNLLATSKSVDYYESQGIRYLTTSNVELWDISTNKLLRTLSPSLSEPSWSVCFSPDGRLLAAACLDGSVLIWDARSWQFLAKLVIYGGGQLASISSVSFSPDGSLLAAASMNDTIVIWDVRTFSKKAVLQGHTNDVMSVSFSPDGKYLASGGRDNRVIIWDLSTNQIMFNLKGHTRQVREVVFTPDSRKIISCSDDGFLLIWNLTKE